MGPSFYIDKKLGGESRYSAMPLTKENECLSHCLRDEGCNFITFKLEGNLGKVCSLYGSTYSLTDVDADPVLVSKKQKSTGKT